MATLSTTNGRRFIQFPVRVGAKRLKKTISLGAVPERSAQATRAHVDHLLSARAGGHALPLATVQWLRDISDDLHAKIVRVGLAAPRGSDAPAPAEIGPFLDAYIDGRTDLKHRTLENLRQCRRQLLKFFPRTRPLASITRGEAGDWHRKMKAKGLAKATVSTHVKKARQMFADAVDRRLIAENPFDKLKAGSQRNAERMQFVSAAAVRRAIGHCPDAEWRLIFALARLGGLRIPSELQTLKWSDVRFDESRMTVTATKKAHLDDKGVRQVPIFPELLPYLRDAFEAAEPGTVHVIARHRGDNLRTQAERIIARAGLLPWAKLFQNLRSSRQTELEERFPTHVVCAWMGNSEAVARRHYLQVTAEHYAMASGGAGSVDVSAAKSAAVDAGQDRTNAESQSKNPRESEGFAESVYPQGEWNNGAITLENARTAERALQKALHATQRTLRRNRSRSIRKLENAVRQAKGGGR